MKTLRDFWSEETKENAMGKATSEEMDALHGAFCELCTEKMKEVEPIQAMTETGPQTVGWKRAIKSGDMSVIRAFMADNKISVDIGSNAGMQELEQELSKEKRFSDRNVVQLPNPKVAVSG